ncbi:MAG TPA: cysteine hydrolase [Rhodanobacter sp.]|nr:cysteine hydrolase [Rhodanobacter sp.]
MAVTTLDPNTALIVIDLQKGILALPVAQPVDTVVKHARALLDAFRHHRLPVVLVNVAGGPPGRTEQPPRSNPPPADWAELIPELDPQPGDHRVTKQTWDAFTHTDLHAWLQTRGVTQVVVVGVATSIGVESTARAAHELGYHVTLAVDAMADRSDESHQHSIAKVFPRLGETGSTQDIIDLLDRRV